jgi:N-methylhydantoinase A
LPGNRIKGPAIVVEYSSTIVIPPNTRAEVDEYGNLLMEIGGNRETEPDPPGSV